MSRTQLSAMQAKGQVTIPAAIRRRLGLKTGDLVTFVETEQGVLIRPQEVIAMGALDAIGKALAEKGVSLDDLLESGQEIRTGLVREHYPSPPSTLCKPVGKGSLSCGSARPTSSSPPPGGHELASSTRRAQGPRSLLEAR